MEPDSPFTLASRNSSTLSFSQRGYPIREREEIKERKKKRDGKRQSDRLLHSCQRDHRTGCLCDGKKENPWGITGSPATSRCLTFVPPLLVVVSFSKRERESRTTMAQNCPLLATSVLQPLTRMLQSTAPFVVTADLPLPLFAFELNTFIVVVNFNQSQS